MASDNESQTSEIPDNGNISDFVYGATDENKLRIEVAVKEDGRCAIFHDKPFRNELAWLEFDIDNYRLNFVLDDGAIRDFGMELSKNMAKNMQNTHQMLMVLMDEQTGDAKEAVYIPLIIHGK